MTNRYFAFLCERKKALLLCFSFALFTRLCAVLLYTFLPKPMAGINADYEYGAIARAIVDGKGYSMPIIEFDSNHNPRGTPLYRPTASQTPFFPLFLAFFYSFSKGPVVFILIRFIHAIISALTCVITYLVALRLINNKAAFIFALLSSLYPLFISSVPRINPEIFFTFWLSLTILYLFFLKESTSLKNIAITGILIGITLLNNNVVTPFCLIIGLWLFFNLKGTFKNKLSKILLVFIIASFVITPWLARNFLVFNKFPLLKTTTGLNLWIGNNPSNTGTFFAETGEDLKNIITEKFPDGFKLSELEEDAILYKDSMDYIKANPINYLKLVSKRFYYYWWFPPHALITENTDLYKKFMCIPYALILLSCIVGIVSILLKNLKEGSLLVALMISIALVYSLFVVGHLRYRLPIEPYILLFASQAIFIFTKRISGVLSNLNKHYV